MDEQGALQITVSKAIRVDDDLLGILVIVFDGADLASAVALTDDSQSLTTVLVKADGDGRIIILTPPEVARGFGGGGLESGGTLPMLRAVKGKEEFDPNAIDSRGVPVLVFTRSIPDLELGFVVKLDRAEAFQGLRRIRNFYLILLGGLHLYLAGVIVLRRLVLGRARSPRMRIASA